jgi:hypothetical protein
MKKTLFWVRFYYHIHIVLAIVFESSLGNMSAFKLKGAYHGLVYIVGFVLLLG